MTSEYYCVGGGFILPEKTFMNRSNNYKENFCRHARAQLATHTNAAWVSELE